MKKYYVNISCWGYIEIPKEVFYNNISRGVIVNDNVLVLFP